MFYSVDKLWESHAYEAMTWKEQTIEVSYKTTQAL